MQKLLSSLALIVAIAALALAWFRPPAERMEIGASPPAAPPVPAPDRIPAVARAELEIAYERIRALEERVDSLTVGQEAIATKPAGDSVTPPLGLSGNLDGRNVALGLVNLEEKTQRLEQDLVDLGVFDHFVKQQEALAETYDQVFDTSLSPKTRVQAARSLKKADQVDGAVVDSLMTLWDESDDAYAAYFIMESLEGVRDAGLRDRLIEYLPGEESPKMRARAVETLAPMLPDPDVERWLRHLHERDPDEHVRTTAARALGRGTPEPAK